MFKSHENQNLDLWHLSPTLVQEMSNWRSKWRLLTIREEEDWKELMDKRVRVRERREGGRGEIEEKGALRLASTLIVVRFDQDYSLLIRKWLVSTGLLGSWIIRLQETSFHNTSRIEGYRTCLFTLISLFNSLTPSSVEIEHALPQGSLFFTSQIRFTSHFLLINIMTTLFTTHSALSSPNSRHLMCRVLTNKAQRERIRKYESQVR